VFENYFGKIIDFLDFLSGGLLKSSEVRLTSNSPLSHTLEGSKMKKLVTWAMVVAVAIYGLGSLFQQSETFRNLVGRHISGMRPVAESAPDRIQNFGKQLRDNLQSFADMRVKIQTQLTEQGQVHRDRDNELLGLRALLAQFKDEYGVGCGPGGFPRLILGRYYTKEAIEEQVGSLLKRQTEMEQQITHLASVTDKLQKSLSDLDQRIGTTKAHLDSMPTYITLVETRDLTGQADQAVKGLESCLFSNEALLDETVRDSAELLKTMEAEKRAAAQKTKTLDFLSLRSLTQSSTNGTGIPVTPVSVTTSSTQGASETNPCPSLTKSRPSDVQAFLETQPASVAK
jgi:hypothetical protein